jgi:hypothetical protein
MNAPSEAGKLTGDLKNVVRASEQLIVAMAGEKAEAVREQLGEMVEAAHQACCKLEEKAKAGLESANQSVRQHPHHLSALPQRSACNVNPCRCS